MPSGPSNSIVQGDLQSLRYDPSLARWITSISRTSDEPYATTTPTPTNAPPSAKKNRAKGKVHKARSFGNWFRTLQEKENPTETQTPEVKKPRVRRKVAPMTTATPSPFGF